MEPTRMVTKKDRKEILPTPVETTANSAAEDKKPHSSPVFRKKTVWQVLLGLPGDK